MAKIKRKDLIDRTDSWVGYMWFMKSAFYNLIVKIKILLLLLLLLTTTTITTTNNNNNNNDDNYEDNNNNN